MIGSYLAEHGGGCFILVLGYMLLIGGPISVLVLLVTLLTDRSTGPRHGILFGVAVAMWASLSELFVPYCGLYPSLPGLLLAQKLELEAPWQLEVFMHGVNFTLWPTVGWFIFFVRKHMRHTTEQGACPD